MCIVSGSFKSQGMGFYILIYSLFLLHSETSSVPDRGRYVMILGTLQFPLNIKLFLYFANI